MGFAIPLNGPDAGKVSTGVDPMGDAMAKSNIDSIAQAQKAFEAAQPKPPPAAPGIGDAALAADQRAQLIRTRMSQGRRSSFLSGPDGDMSMPPASALGGNR